MFNNYQLFKIIIIMLVSIITINTTSAQNIDSKKKKNIPKKQICITFDELPIATYFADPEKDSLTDMILSALKKHNVKSCGFVVGSKMENNYDLLGKWLNAGHRLGNLTYSYQDLKDLEINNFIKDVISGSEALEPMLSGFGQKPRFFRFPFLHYGENEFKKERIKNFLSDYKIKVVHATVVVEDYVYNLAIEKSNGKLDSAAYDEMLNEYINHVLDQIEHAEGLSKDILHRDCRQILQLRANHLNAIFLDELLTQIENLGYKFITVDHALKDKLYKIPESYFGSIGIGFLDMIKQSKTDK